MRIYVTDDDNDNNNDDVDVDVDGNVDNNSQVNLHSPLTVHVRLLDGGGTVIIQNCDFNGI